MNSEERALWANLPVLDGPGAAHYIGLGQPELKRSVLLLMRRDYHHALLQLHGLAAAQVHKLRDDAEPFRTDWPPGVLTEPGAAEGEPVHELWSIGLEETWSLLNHGEPEMAHSWTLSDGCRFERQLFRRSAIQQWARIRGLAGAVPTALAPDLHPKEKTSLYKLVVVLAGMCELDLSRHSASATQVVNAAALQGIRLGQRTIEKHFREIHANTEVLRRDAEG